MSVMLASPSPIAVAENCRCCPPTGAGSPWELGSATFWVEQARNRNFGAHRLSHTLEGELVACMLGGFGVPGHVGVAAFNAVDAAGLLDASQLTSDELADALTEVLSTPFHLAHHTRPVRYRFWRQRPRRIADALSMLRTWIVEPGWAQVLGDARRLRDRLKLLPGVGPKTASWIVRNHLDSDEVAIIDIHIARAGTSAGVFCRNWSVTRDYDEYEQAFLAWARRADVRASSLDATIWHTLAKLGPAASQVLGRTRTGVTGEDSPHLVARL